MRRSLLCLLALSAIQLQAAVTVTSIGVNPLEGSVTYSTIALTINASGAFTDWRVRVSASSCAAGTGGYLQPSFNGGASFPTGFNILVTGLAKNTPYFFCVELSDSGPGGTYSTGSSGEIQATTSAIEETAPRPPARFNSDYPNTGDFATMPTCPSVNAQNYCKTAVPFGTTDIRSYFDTAIGNQCSHGTILAFAHSATPVVFTQNIYSSVYAACPVLFWDASKISGNIIDFGSPHGLIEGQLLTWGQHGFQTAPSSSSCYQGSGFLEGNKFHAHFVSTTAISLFCEDGTTPLIISSPGTAASNTLFFLPHVAASGQCPDKMGGTSACTYDRVNSYEVILRSDADDKLLPRPGSRMSPSYCASGLCSIWVNPVSNVGSSSSTHAFYNPGNNDGNVHNMVSNVRIGPGIEVTNEVDPGQGTYANLIVLPGYGSDNKIDRVYIHGGETRPPTLQRWGGPSLQAGQLEGHNSAIINNWIDNLRQWHSVAGTDGASIIISEGPGPHQFINNEIQGAGIPIHFDGGALPVRLFGDIQMLRNHFFVPPFMIMGNAASDGHWSGHRQQAEWKAGRRSEVFGNIFDTNPAENNPNSCFIVATAVSGTPPIQGISVTDLNISFNTFKHGAGGVCMPIVVYGGGRVPISPARYNLTHNLFYDINGPKWEVPGTFPAGYAKGWITQGPGSGEAALVDHNTIVGNVGSLPYLFSVQNSPFSGLTFTNNFTYGYGVSDGGLTQTGGVNVGPCFNQTGEALMTTCFTPSFVFQRNVMMSNLATAAQIATKWPINIAGNYNPTNMSLAATPGWINYDSSGDGGSYGLKSTSNYRSGAAKTLTSGPATDGLDVGINEPSMLRAQGHARLASVTAVGSTTATVNFTAPDGISCPVRVAATPWGATVPTSGVLEFPDAGASVGARSVSLTGLPSGSMLYGIVMCSVEQPTFQFRTQ